MRLLSFVTLLTLAATAAPAAAAPARELDLVSIGRTAAAGENGAEISSFDPATKRAFVTNGLDKTLDIFDLSNPAAPVRIRQVDLSPYGAGPTSVDVSPRDADDADDEDRDDDERGARAIVAVSVPADVTTDPGTVQFFNTNGDRLGEAPTGALPDSVTFANRSRTLLVANEGEPNDAYTIDPEGSVTIVDLRRGVSRARVRTATFGGVPLSGPVRIFGPGASPAQDLEPEYIAVAPDDETAFVTLQENNAIGILDVEDARFRVVRSLGFKNHGLPRNALDASDRDGAINIRPWNNLFGMYQPDAIAAYELRGRVRLVTANEGDAREYAGFSEQVRASTLPLDPVAFPPGTQAAAALGRLNVTNTLGNTDGDPAFEQLYAFGARSMSILDTRAALVYDTGDELERYTALVDPLAFNTDHTPAIKFDDRSDNKGPEPEGVDTGVIGGRPYAFLSNERQGAIFAFDMAAQPGEASRAGYVNTRPADRGPEGLHFVAARDSPTRRPLVLSTNEITGTLSIIEVRPR